MAKERTPERAKAVLDRASRMSKFKAPLADRRLFDKQISTPGAKSKPLNLNGLEGKHFKKLGKQTINIKDIVSDQPTVSVKQVKGKIDQVAAGRTPEVRLVRRPDGKYMMLDGNHGTTAQRALGKKAISAQVFELNLPKATPSAVNGASAKSAAEIASKALMSKGGKAAVAGAAIAGVSYLAAKGFAALAADKSVQKAASDAKDNAPLDKNGDKLLPKVAYGPTGKMHTQAEIAVYEKKLAEPNKPRKD